MDANAFYETAAMTLKVAKLARERINEHMRKGAQGKGKGGYASTTPAENEMEAWRRDQVAQYAAASKEDRAQADAYYRRYRPGPPGWTDGRMDMLQPKKGSQEMDIQADVPEGSQDGPQQGGNSQYSGGVEEVD